MNKEITGSLIWAGGVIALALGATVARQQGLIDADMVNRIVMGAIGLMVAWWGNQAPKRFAPGARAQQVNRVAGWSLAVSGLVYGGLWAFAPMEAALWGGCGAIILGMAVTIGYCLSQRGRATAA